MDFEKLPKASWFTNVAWDPVRDMFGDGTTLPSARRFSLLAAPPQNRSFLGLSLEKGSPTVSQVQKGSPAEQVGIKSGDKLPLVGDEKIGTVADLLKVVQSTEPGTELWEMTYGKP
jgi:S1-C subfamily serine protease